MLAIKSFRELHSHNSYISFATRSSYRNIFNTNAADPEDIYSPIIVHVPCTNCLNDGKFVTKMTDHFMYSRGIREPKFGKHYTGHRTSAKR